MRTSSLSIRERERERKEGEREEEYVFILQLSGGLWWDGRQQSIRPTDRPTTEGETGTAAVLFRSPPIKEVLKNNHTRGAAAVGAGAGRSSNSAF